MARMTLIACAGLFWGAMALAGEPVGLALGHAPHAQRASASAFGLFYSYDEQAGLYEFQRFEVTEYRDVTGNYSDTRVTLHEGWNWSGGYAERTLICPVGRDALKVQPHKATVSANFDAEAPDCYSSGLIHSYHPEVITPWGFTGIQTLLADLLSPSYTERRVSNYRFQDNETGTTSSENCRGGAGWEPQAGGFTLNGTYRAFDADDVSGDFTYDACGTSEK
jgi:hypothetical protein